MIALLIATAMGDTANVEYCVKFDVEFERAKNPGGGYNYAVGWFWSNNAIDQNARKVFVTIADSGGNTQKVQLGSNGCVFVDVEGGPPGVPIETKLTVLNEARFNGVDVELRQGPQFGFWTNANDVAVSFLDITVTDGSRYNFTVQATDGWQQMAVAGWMLDRTNWRLEDKDARGCCLESGTMDLDGTCSGANPDPYTRTSDPYLMTAPLIALGASTDNLDHCCGSSRNWSSSTTETGLSAGMHMQNRFGISHEIGHMLAGIRMGGPERSEYPGNVPHDGCNGDYNSAGTAPLPFHLRGVFSKEYAAVGFREGWATFVSAWTWDRSIQAAPGVCEFIFMDIDVDVDVDNYYGLKHPYNKCYKFGGAPEFTTTADPTAPWAANYGTNWLESAIVNVGTCVYTTECPSGGNTDMERYNRTTISDVANMYWSLYNGDNVPAADLLSLYVDMCPRGWRQNDDVGGPEECTDELDLPYRRAELSATTQGLSTEVGDALLDHLEH